MIKIIDYGLGNIQAFLNTYKRLGIAAERVTGVGAFDRAMALFNRSGMREPMERLVHDGVTRVLGVCVGMQMLAAGSDEGSETGLGWVPGSVRHFADRPETRDLACPHMGWNDVEPEGPSPLFDGMESPRFYFLHSYYFECTSPANRLATANYGLRFPCAVSAGNVWGVQFHPEKSHHWGQMLLGNFARS
jgi:imidazole glycerol-phosphate synthase subunit HisH